MSQAHVVAVLAIAVAGGPVVTAGDDPPIQDNSFLLEEAYNQEQGVVQHIQGYSRVHDSGSWTWTFTQEWPVGSARHQVSYTLAAVEVRGEGTERGFGDVAVHYRYQLVGGGDATVAMAPRASVLFPTGDYARELGFGGFGVQANLPLSVVLGERWVSHVNLGATWIRGARDTAGHRADISAWSGGQSFVWLARPRLNALVEFSFTSGERVTGPDATETEDVFLVSPGLRWAHDLRSGLQIVPGVAVPLGVGPSSGSRAVFVYLSFEHPFRRGPQ